MTEHAPWYAGEVETIEDCFNYEDCEHCGKGLDAHTIAPGLLGHAQVWCNNSSDE